MTNIKENSSWHGLSLNTIYNMDCIEWMKLIPDWSIDLTVTSPPYDNLRTYNWYSWDFEWVAKELYRVTKQWGVIVWIVWDATSKFSETWTSFRQALYFKDECWLNLLDTMIYYKQNYAPAYPTLRRYANQFEYMFIFSKWKPKTFNPIQREKIEHKNWKTRFRKPDWTKIDKFIITERKTKDASNVWSYPVWNKTIDHPAVFPEKLAEDHILSWSNEWDIVLDPFMWSGTTAKMALINNRNYIWFELSQEYVDIANKRIQGRLSDNTLFS